MPRSIARRLFGETVRSQKIDVSYDVSKNSGALLHLGHLQLVQFLTDEVRDAVLSNDDRDAEEDLVGDAVPALRQRADCEHAPLQCIHAQLHSSGPT